MIITICSSAFFAKESFDIKKKLEDRGHTVFIYPEEIKIDDKIIHVTDFYNMRKNNLTNDLVNVKSVLIKEHFKNIENSDAILVLNFDRDGEEGYVGGNTFLEMGVAYYLNKKIFLWKFPMKKLPYFEEILSMNPRIIDGDIDKIK
ncbi:MAG: hypothetical protein J7L45_03215 [Candidatus Aenigmarchaeota archaeon]|nr:hypothetical protein [Candidatus Aenigmarchaeota archaeon]